MKTRKLLYLIPAIAMVIAGTTLVSSCKKSETTVTPAADVTALTAALAAANTLHTNAVEGTKPGKYTAGSKATFKTSIDLATTVKTGGTKDAAVVTNAIAQLNAAVALFQTKLIQEVSAANLIAQWKFNGNALDATANANNGSLQSGLVGMVPGTDGATLPVLIADRFNQAGMAYEFANGANIEVPYKVMLNPAAITISMWVKSYETKAGNYLISVNRWHGYKLELEDHAKVFFTTQLPNVGVDQKYFDHDSEGGIVPFNTWTHIAVSYTVGSAKFYINGVLTKEWTDATAAIAVPNPALNLCIGQQYPKNTPHLAMVPENPNEYYNGGNFFHGAMDDVRIYNKALTAAEVNSIFVIENTL